jgi:hypothetical protein
MRENLVRSLFSFSIVALYLRYAMLALRIVEQWGLCLELLMLLLQEWLQGKVRGLVLGFKEAGLETLATQGV